MAGWLVRLGLCGISECCLLPAELHVQPCTAFGPFANFEQEDSQKTLAETRLGIETLAKPPLETWP